jgi:hypothetical protein
MALMAVSQGAYLGTKIVNSSNPKLLNLKPTSAKSGDAVTINGSGFVSVAGTVQFGDAVATLQTAIRPWTDATINVVLPP